MEWANQALAFLREHAYCYEEFAKWQRDVWQGDKPDQQPLLLSCTLDEGMFPMPEPNFQEIHKSSENMLAHGLRPMVSCGFGLMGAVPSLRANMGCGIFPTLFGVTQRVFPNMMPWVKDHLSKQQLARMGVDDLALSEEFKRGLAHMAFFAEQLAGTGCLVFPMDVQGPLDVAHLVYGDALFYDLYDDPAFVHHLLDLACHSIVLGLTECLRVIPEASSYIAHYNGLVMPASLGGVKLSEDTTTLLAPQHVREFGFAYSTRVLAHFGGGYIHYCGDNAALYAEVVEHPLVFGLNLGNPERHVMEDVVADLARRSKVYYGPLPQREGESLDAYFRRYVQAARLGERINLLPVYTCAPSERNRVLHSWLACCEESGGDQRGISYRS